jgi:hypothetical protein
MTEYYSKIKCLGCGAQLTWAKQRRQFGRTIRAGLTPEEIKTLVPRCQKCMTEVLHARGLRGTQPPRRLQY